LLSGFHRLANDFVAKPSVSRDRSYLINHGRHSSALRRVGEVFRRAIFIHADTQSLAHGRAPPQQDGQMGRLPRWVTAPRSLRYHGHYHTRGEVHIYQSRFKCFPVQDDAHC